METKNTTTSVPDVARLVLAGAVDFPTALRLFENHNGLKRADVARRIGRSVDSIAQALRRPDERPGVIRDLEAHIGYFPGGR